MASVFDPAELRRVICAALDTLPPDAPAEQVIARVHSALRARWPDDITPDLRWTRVSAAFGTQSVAPLFASMTEYVCVTGTPFPTGGESGRFLATLEDHVISGEIETASPQDPRPSRFSRGQTRTTLMGEGYAFAVRDHVWMIEHLHGALPLALLYPVWSTLFSTLDFPSLYHMLRNTTALVLGRWWRALWGVQRPTWRNWLGNQRARPRAIRRPNNAYEVMEIIREARSDPSLRPVRPFGTSHSWSALVPGDGTLIDMRGMTSVLGVDRANRVLHLEPGVPLNVALQLAWQEGWRIKSVTAIKTLTVGGMLAVGAHGTGKAAASFSDEVIEITLIDGEGQRRVFDTTDPVGLNAARTALGALGVVVSFKIQCTPSGLFHYRCLELDPRSLRDQATIDRLAEQNDLIEIYVFPFVDRALGMTWNELKPGEPPPAGVPVYGPAQRLWGWLLQNIGQFVIGSPVAFVIDRLWPAGAPLLARLSMMVVNRNESLQTPLDAGHYLYAYHKVRDSGFGVPERLTADAFAAYMGLIQREADRGHYPINICVHMRFMQPGTALLGYLPDGQGQRPPRVCQIEAATTAGADHSQAYYEEIERLLVGPAFKGQPHWAKEWWLDVHPFFIEGSARWAEFEALRDQCDPQRIFDNDLLKRLLLDAKRVDQWLVEHQDGVVDPREALRQLLSEGGSLR
jgi:FAD/FMN-containing dehydrogenase